MPSGFNIIAVIALLAGLVCALIIVLDVLRRPQHMAIMNVVWPITGLYAGPLALWFYYRWGRGGHTGKHDGKLTGKHGVHDGKHGGEKPFHVAVGIGATHCGAGCALGDIVAEWLAFAYPAVAVWFGWHSLFDEKMFAVWFVDFIFAFSFGILFQYFAIVPMRNLSFRDGIVAAIKADTLSLIAWQIGMYGFMALAQFVLIGKTLKPDTLEFWFIMQIAMICGFVTSYPVNWWLIRAGIKEKM